MHPNICSRGEPKFMSYQVLARKWRPRFFDEMVGQEHVLRALINALNEGRLHHAYLFTGTRGVGKTTIARILAKCLNCEEGVSARPCGQCSSCREIAEGRFVDLIEVDAASRTRVEDTRELLDNVQYAPTRGRFKVYLIDEVHMLSTHSFNALLKTLEEPPAHVKFLLATTDPQKLPVTILSRCLQFSLKNMTPERIVSYLGKVLDAEEITYEEPALWALGRAAQGSMRDALSLTDQAIAYGEGQVGESQVNAMLGTMDRGRLFRLAGLMAQADASQVLAEVAAMSEHAPDFDEVLQGLLHIWHRASLAQVVPDAIENSEGDRDAILKLSMAMPAEDLQLYYQIALQGRKDLALAPDPRQGFEMVLLRMLTFRPAPDVVPELDLESALQKKKPLTPAESSQPKTEAVAPVVPDASADIVGSDAGEIPQTVAESPVVSEAPAVSETPVVIEPQAPLAGSAPASVAPDEELYDPADTAGDSFVEMPDAEDGWGADSPSFSDEDEQAWNAAMAAAEEDDTDIASDSEPGVAPDGRTLTPATPRTTLSSMLTAEAPVTHIESGVSERTVPDQSVMDESAAAAPLPELAPHTWWMWVERLPLAGLPMAIARNSALVGDDNGILMFDVDPAQGALYNESQQSRVQDALRTLLPGVSLKMALCPPRGETPDQRRHRLKVEALYAARHAIDSDPLVNQILSELGGRVNDDTVRPNS